MSKAVTFAREPHRRAMVRVESWWGRAFLRAIEELAYDDNLVNPGPAPLTGGR